MLNKIFNTALAVVLISLCVGCKPKLAPDEYLIKGRIEAGSNADEVVLMYFMSDPPIMDTAKIKGNSFEFRGSITEPSMDAQAALMFPSEGGEPDAVMFFLEPGEMRITIDADLKDTRIEGSPLNAEYREWEAMKNEPGADIPAQALDYVKRHPDSKYAAEKITFDIKSQLLTPDYIRQLHDAFSPALQQTQQVQELLDMIAFKENIKTGKIAPDFTLNDMHGNPVSLSEMRGQWVFLDFWSSGCGPCRAENKHVKKAYDQLRNKNFNVLSVSGDRNNAAGKKAWLRAIEEDGMPWIHVIDDLAIEINGKKTSVSDSYNVVAIPASFLISPQGRIVAKDLHGENLTEIILSYME